MTSEEPRFLELQGFGDKCLFWDRSLFPNETNYRALTSMIPQAI